MGVTGICRVGCGEFSWSWDWSFSDWGMIPSHLQAMNFPGVASFEEDDHGMIRLAITSPKANAQIYLHGAHVVHFQPIGLAPVLFLSEESGFASGQAIRGGIPICFPWFGGREGHPESPAHGFARTMEWAVESLSVDGDEAILVILRLESNEATRAEWAHEFVVRCHIFVGMWLVMLLEVENTGESEMTFEEALHTYFAVEDVREVLVRGLENTGYRDKVDGLASKMQGAEPLRFTGETDRIFENTAAKCEIEDGVTGRRITVNKSGSKTTVVWNPWIEKALKMKDFGDEEWRRMICVETANAGVNAVTIGPGKKHSIRVVISPGSLPSSEGR